jgi:type I restriction enzyme S subunit
MLRRGDLLLEKSGGGDLQPVGAVVAYDHDEQAVCSNFVARMPIADGYLPFFVNYLHFTLYANRVNIRSIKQTTGIQNLDGKAYLSELVAFPPPDEQAAVVRFLDWANRRLERTIRAKQKVIALLNEQKQAVIHRAVTRGLDPSVPLKPSGIPWLEEIPAHWEVRKLKYDVTFRGGGTPSKGNVAYWGGTIPWVSPKDMKADVIHDSEDHITERAVAESSTNLVPAGSLLMVVRSGILQRTIPAARCAREVALNQDMKAITSKGRLDLDYFVMLIRGCEKRLLRAWTKQGTTVESIEHQDMANTKIPMPPLDEQTQIVANLAFETSPLTNALLMRAQN